MEFRVLPIFKEISDSSCKKLEEQSVLYKFRIGQPMAALGNIPSEILIIVEGEARLVAKEGDKASLVAGVTKNLTSDIKAGDLMKHVSSQLDGKGGGRPDMAMGAASDLTNLSQALESVAIWVEDNLA